MREDQPDKDEYILRSLSKIRHKRHEYFVISRMIHNLHPYDIEFVCQQLVHTSDGKYYLTDIFFPNLDLHVEVDEKRHEHPISQLSDQQRTQEIVSRTDNRVWRVPCTENGHARPLADVASVTDAICRKLIAEHKEMGAPRWELNAKYDPQLHIDAGRLTLDRPALFRYQKHALRCLGYKGGHYQLGTRNVPELPNTIVWFPRLWETKDWHNSIESDGRVIKEIDKSEKSLKSNPPRPDVSANRIVFARTSDSLGKTLYRFVGTFIGDLGRSNQKVVFYNRISSELDLSTFRTVKPHDPSAR